MNFGMPVFLEQNINDSAALCKEHGLSFIELNTNFPDYHAHKLDVGTLSKLADKNDIFYTLHLDDHLSPCDFYDDVANAYTKTVMDAIDAAKQLHIPILNIHLSKGGYVTLPHERIFLFDRYQNEYKAKLMRFKDACETAIGDSNIKICIENFDSSFCADFMQKSIEILLQSSVFGITFDIGHNAEADFKEEPFIMKHAEKLHHFHIHDAKGKKPHLPFGEGELNIKKYLDLAKNKTALIEVKTVEGLLKSIKWMEETK